MRKPRIVIVIRNLVIGGAERVMLDLAAGFSRHGAKAHIVILENIVQYVVPPEISVHHLNWDKIKKSGRPSERLSWFQRFKVAWFIHRNCGKPNLVLANLPLSQRIFADSRWNVHFVIHNTMSIRYPKVVKMFQTIYPKKPAVCVSKGVMEDFIQALPNLKFPPKYIHNPVHQKWIEKLSQEKSPLDIENYIIHVGNFKPPKRHDILIKAYHLAKIQTPLVLVGYERQENYEAEIHKLVKDLNLENQVIFAGKQSNPYPLIKAAKFLVLSSDVEGLPTVLLEACALETPAISTDCPSGANEILPSENLCPIGNIEALAKLMQKADKNPEQYRVPLAQKFTLDFATEQYLKLLK